MPHPSSAIHRIAHPHRPPSSSHCANGAYPSKKPPSICAIHRHRRKTAEERFHTLARGWLAYPVTPMHAHLPPKSGCICHPPICKSNDTHSNAITLQIIYTTALRRLPSAIGHPLPKTHPSSSHCANVAIHRHRRKPPKSGCITVIPSVCLPRDANARTSTAEERLYKRHPIGLPTP